MNKKLIRTAREMLRIANDLDDIGMFVAASAIDRAAVRIISAQAGVNELVAPNLLDPEQIDEVEEKRQNENEQLGDMLSEDEDTLEEQRGLLDDHEEEVESPLKDMIQQ